MLSNECQREEIQDLFMGQRCARSAAVVCPALQLLWLSSSRIAQPWRRSVEKIEKRGRYVSETFPRRKEGRRVPLDPLSFGLLFDKHHVRVPSLVLGSHIVGLCKLSALSTSWGCFTGLHPLLYTTLVVLSVISSSPYRGRIKGASGGTDWTCTGVKQRAA